MLKSKLSVSKRVIKTTEDAVPLLSKIADLHQEHFVVISLDAGYRVIEKRAVFIGTMTATLVHPREVFFDAINDRAAAIIIAHNHPSGDATPSKEDTATTKQLIEAGKIIGIQIIDHIIVAKNDYYSFKSESSVDFF